MGSSTAVVSRFTTSIECRLMSMFTSTEKYSLIWLDAWRNAGQRPFPENRRSAKQRTISFSSASIAILGLFSTSSCGARRTAPRVSRFAWQAAGAHDCKGTRRQAARRQAAVKHELRIRLKLR